MKRPLVNLTPAEVAGLDLDQLVPWGLTEEQYAELAILCLDQAGMSMVRQTALRAELGLETLGSGGIDHG